MSRTLKKILILNFTIIIVAILALVLIILISFNRISEARNKITEEYTSINKFYQAEVAHFKWANSLNSAINYGIEFKGSLDPTECDFGKYIYGNGIQNDVYTQKFFEDIEPIHNSIHNSAEDILREIETNPIKAASNYNNIVLPHIESLVSKLDSFIVERSSFINQANHRFTQALILSVVACAIVIVLIILLIIRLYIFMRNEVIRNLSSLAKQTERLSQGRLNLELPITCKTTEMLQIRDSIENSVKELSKYIEAIDYEMSELAKGNFTYECPVTFLGDFIKIQESVKIYQAKMNNTLVEIDMTSAQVRAGVSQVANGAQDVAQGAIEQANSVEELSATVSEISRQLTQTAEHSEAANTLGKKTGEIVQKSQDEMKQMIAAIRNISSASEDIKKIIIAIDDIAIQTNILALNAAVEAARAGNAGKGFAVVADEVRNLAQRSAEAAKDTTKLIENTIKQVSYGEKLAASADAAFDKVAKFAEDILKMIENIAQASNAQALSITEISESVEQISAVVQMNSATSEESAATSEELSGLTNVMMSLIDQFELVHTIKSSCDTDTKGICQDEVLACKF